MSKIGNFYRHSAPVFPSGRILSPVQQSREKIVVSTSYRSRDQRVQMTIPNAIALLACKGWQTTLKVS
jgi:hypothetical protein